MIVYSTEGGIDIEEVADKTPEKIYVHPSRITDINVINQNNLDLWKGKR